MAGNYTWPNRTHARGLVAGLGWTLACPTDRINRRNHTYTLDTSLINYRSPQKHKVWLCILSTHFSFRTDQQVHTVINVCVSLNANLLLQCVYMFTGVYAVTCIVCVYAFQTYSKHVCHCFWKGQRKICTSSLSLTSGGTSFFRNVSNREVQM